MFKKYVLFIILFLLSISYASSYSDIKYFCNEQSNQLSEVNAIGWRCIPKDSDTCENVDQTKPVFSAPMPVSTGSTNYLEAEFSIPDNPSDYYLWFYYTDDYVVKVVSSLITYTFVDECTSSSWSTLTKADNCKAEFSPAITSCAEQGLPISILTDTNLDVETQSAFSEKDYYWPPELDAWREVETDMRIDIRRQGSSYSVSGYPQTQTADIYADTTHNFNFVWYTTRNTEPGTYTVSMTSTVPDAKCDQTNDIPVTQTQTVYVAESFDGCRNDITFQKTTPDEDIAIGSPVQFSGTHLNVWQDWEHTGENCDIQGTLLDGDIFGASYELSIYRGQTLVHTRTGTLPQNTNYQNPRSFSLSYTPTQCGNYRAVLEVTSTGDTSVCEPETITSSYELTFEIGTDNDNDGWCTLDGDCDDNNYFRYPENSNLFCNCVSSDQEQTAETCDGLDNDCDGQIDEDVTDCAIISYFCDSDRDGLFSTVPYDSCETNDYQCINLYSTNCRTYPGDDCNDYNSDLNDPVVFYRDQDGDGFGDPSVTSEFCLNNAPDDFVENNHDCNDDDPDINPDAEEICDSFDNNCNGQTDEDGACTQIDYYCNEDNDLYFSRILSGTCNGDNCWPASCRDYPGTDCDDTDSAQNPGRIYYYRDDDNDGYGAAQLTAAFCPDSVPSNYVSNYLDCDDDDDARNPDAEEICDGIDNDCDYLVDLIQRPCSSFSPYGICSEGYSICEDGEWSGCVNPGDREEDCDDLSARDEDCDGYSNCADSDCIGFFAECSDSDNDGYTDDVDCSPDNYFIYPDNNNPYCDCISATASTAEFCDIYDNDCDGQNNENLDCDQPVGFYCDSDRDSFYSDEIYESCSLLDNSCINLYEDNCLTSPGNDCSDSNEEINPAAEEVCDGIDNNCNNIADEGCFVYCDMDNDSYFSTSPCEENCSDSCRTTQGNDCNDDDPDINPGAEEICDSINNDCDSTTDEGCLCIPGEEIECSSTGVCSELSLTCTADGTIPQCDYTSLPNYQTAETTCDGLDNDCDGLTDAEEGLACCSSGSQRSCVKTCEDGTRVQGYVRCSNFVWSTQCIAECPEIQQYAVEITTPAERTYKTCDEDLYLRLDYRYNGRESCLYKLNTGQFRGTSSTIRPRMGDNTLTVKCGAAQDIIEFSIEERESCSDIPVTQDPTVVFEQEADDKYTIEDINKAKAAQKETEQTIKYSYDSNADNTEIEIKLSPQKNLGSSDYHLFIPKCLAEYLDEIEFDSEDYEVIKEDPIIAWHFDDLDRPFSQNMRVKGEIDEKCLEQIQGMVIADLIDYEDPKPLLPALGGMVFVLGAVGFVWMEVKLKPPKRSGTDPALATMREHWLERVKAQGFKSKDDAAQFMDQMRLPDNLKDYILKELY